MQTLSNLSANQILSNIAVNIASALPSLGLDGQHIRRTVPTLQADGSIVDVADSAIRWTLTTGLSEDKFCQTFSIGVIEFWASPDANGRPIASTISASDLCPWFGEWPARAFPGMWPILLGKTRYEQEDLALVAFQSDETEAVLFVLDMIASERGSDLVTETDAREFRQRQSLRPFDAPCIGRILAKLERLSVECAKEVHNQSNPGYFNPQFTYANGANAVDSTPRLTLLVWRASMAQRLSNALGKPTATGMFGQNKEAAVAALATADAALAAALTASTDAKAALVAAEAAALAATDAVQPAKDALFAAISHTDAVADELAVVQVLPQSEGNDARIADLQAALTAAQDDQATKTSASNAAVQASLAATSAILVANDAADAAAAAVTPAQTAQLIASFQLEHRTALLALLA